MTDKYNINLAESIDILSNKGNTELDKLLYDLSMDISNQLREALVKRNINTTSLGLSQSIKPTKPEIVGNGIEVEIQADHYWKFVNYGVNGTKEKHGAPEWGTQPKTGTTFHQEILAWIPKRGVMAKPDENGNIPTYDQIAWAIQGKIRRDGIKPRPFYNDVINNKLVGIIRPQIEKLIGRTIEVNITFPWQ